jgi:serine/threonine-protein kinase
MLSPRLLALALAATLPLSAAAADAEDPADPVRALLKKRCAECHEGDKARAGLQILNLEALKKSKIVQPGKPEDSELLQLVECGTMPAGLRDKLDKADVKILRDWIKGGAEIEVEPSGDPVLIAIAEDIKRQRADNPDGLRFLRYISFRHLQPAGPDADTCLQALTRCLNLLNWMTEPIKPEPVDSTRTIFRIDLRKLEWAVAPYRTVDLQKAAVNVYDVLLLEYPLAPAALDVGGELGAVLSDYLNKARQVRPVVYVRGDWLLAAALQPPLYEDLLQVPRPLRELEFLLKVNREPGLAVRGGLLDSTSTAGVRLVNRRPIDDDKGFLWQTFDRPAAQGGDELLKGAETGAYTSSQALFRLPNGLPGFFQGVWDPDKKDCVRRPSLPARDGSAMTLGRGCLRCHQQGPQRLQDAARGLIEKASLADLTKDDLKNKYRGQGALDKVIGEDRRAVATAVEKIHGKTLDGDPLEKFWQRVSPDKMPRPAPGNLLPLDGLTLPDWEPQPNPVDVTLTARERKSDKQTTLFHPGDELVVQVKNQGRETVEFELDVITADGKAYQREAGRRLEPGQTYNYPADRRERKRPFVEIGPPAGQDRYILYVAPASASAKFPAGVVLDGERNGTDRILHRWYEWSDVNHRAMPPFDPKLLVKKTLVIETEVPPGKD